MISTSGRLGLGRLQESCRQTQIRFLTIKLFGMTKLRVMRRSKTARNSMGPSAWLEKRLESRQISAQPERKTEIEKRS
jgi:hypothetical protein